RKRRLEGFGSEDQSGLFGGLITFVHVAAVACGDQVGPDGLATFRLGYDVIDGQVSLAPAILALALISSEKIGAIEQNPAKWNGLVMRQSDDRRIFKAPTHRADRE